MPQRLSRRVALDEKCFPRISNQILLIYPDTFNKIRLYVYIRILILLNNWKSFEEFRITFVQAKQNSTVINQPVCRKSIYLPPLDATCFLMVLLYTRITWLPFGSELLPHYLQCQRPTKVIFTLIYFFNMILSELIKFLSIVARLSAL